ncbi:MAG: transposase [Phycisphaerae bacterium]
MFFHSRAYANARYCFFVDDDRRVYLTLLAEETAALGVTITGFCLMSNHIHLIATRSRANALARAIGRVHFRYAQYINRLHQRSGHLWQNRFFSCPLGPHHLLRALRYVERNPARASMTTRAWNYPWSSAAFHTGNPLPQNFPPGLLNGAVFKPTPEAWQSFLQLSDDPRDVTSLRRATHTGRPLAGESILSKFEKLLGRRLRALPTGRPRKA